MRLLVAACVEDSDRVVSSVEDAVRLTESGRRAMSLSELLRRGDIAEGEDRKAIGEVRAFLYGQSMRELRDGLPSWVVDVVRRADRLDDEQEAEVHDDD